MKEQLCVHEMHLGLKRSAHPKDGRVTIPEFKRFLSQVVDKYLPGYNCGLSAFGRYEGESEPSMTLKLISKCAAGDYQKLYKIADAYVKWAFQYEVWIVHHEAKGLRRVIRKRTG